MVEVVLARRATRHMNRLSQQAAKRTPSEERIMKSQQFSTHRSGHRSRRHRHTRTAELFRTAGSTRDAVRRQAALDEVVVLNMDVARSLVAPYSGRGIAVEDLEQVAYAALVRAARAFDSSRADDFLAYAVPTVRGEIKKHFRDH